MNGVLALVLAVLIYPGALVATVAAWGLSWARDAARAAVSGGAAGGPVRLLAELRGAFGQEASAAGVYAPALTLASGVALLSPLLALVLLPVPGNPLVAAIGPVSDLTLVGALLLGMPLARLFIGWAIPSPVTRAAADMSARLLAGALLPMCLALAASAEQWATLEPVAPHAAGSTIALAARVLSAAAFACVVPVLARATFLRAGEGDAALPGGELAEVSGRDLASFRVAEGLQLAAVAAFFAVVFVLPLAVGIPAGTGRGLVVLVGVVLTAVGAGLWDGWRGRRPEGTDHAPLTWWLGLPLLVALVALVAASVAQRGG
jgi:hypothetical protein